MKKQNLIKAAETIAAKESNIKASDLLKDLEPHYREFYIADIENCGEHLIISFRNGQKFKLTAEEI